MSRDLTTAPRPSACEKPKTRLAWCDRCMAVTRHQWGEKKRPCKKCGYSETTHAIRAGDYLLGKIADIFHGLSHCDQMAFFHVMETIAGAANMANTDSEYQDGKLRQPVRIS